jgi:hypothetical protein
VFTDVSKPSASREHGPEQQAGGSQTVLTRFRALALTLALTLAVFSSAAPTLAAKGSDGGKGGSTGGSSSLTLVLLNSTDGLPHWGQKVTFNIQTTATGEPNVSLNCYLNGALVYAAVAGFYASYPWPGTQIMTLASPSWTGGAADCTARLYYISGARTVTLQTLSFHVYA